MADSARRHGRGSIVLGLGLGMLAIALLVFGGLVFLYFSDLTLPGVQALGVDLGGKTQEQAVEALRDEWDSHTIVVAAGKATWTLPPSKLGFVLDADGMVEQAHAQGRSADTLSRLFGTGGVTVNASWTFDPGVAESFLRLLAAQLQVPAQDPTLRIVDGRVEEMPAVEGQALDMAGTLDGLSRHRDQVLGERRLDLILMPVDPVLADLKPAIAQADEWLAEPRTIHLYDPISDERLTWTITQTVLGSWLTLVTNPEAEAFMQWDVQAPKVAAYLTAQAENLGPSRYIQNSEALSETLAAVRTPGQEVALRIYHKPQTHIVQSGETLSSIADDYGMPYPWIQQANPKLGDMLQVGQEITIPSQDDLLPLPVVENKRIVVSIKEQMVRVFEDGNLKWEWRVSTGISSSPTSPGIFQIQTHEMNAYAANWNLWMPYFMGIYRPVPTQEFMNGFHGFPSRGGQQIIWTRNLGTPITYGCILISSENAETLYNWAEEGIVVEIKP